MYKTEKQFENNASKLTIEETFMNIDSPDTSFDPYIGYRFHYPIQFTSNPSNQKMIGLRSLNITPSSHSFVLTLDIENETEVVWSMSITDENNLQEILESLRNLFLQQGYDFLYNYNNNTGTLILSCKESVNGTDTNFKFTTIIQENTNEFLRFLNQEINADNRAILNNYSLTKTFYNVWDRRTLYFHSSFSNSNRGIIGRNNDFWTTPNKRYIFRDNTNDFYIFFTTNGVNRIFPYHCNFYLELSFIINYNKTIV
jgi:hypothetical protein